MKNAGNLLEFVYALFGVKEGKSRDEKLMKGNRILSDRRLFVVICIVVFIATILALNALLQILHNLGGLIIGTVPWSILFLPSAKFIPFYIFGIILATVFSVMLAYTIHVNFIDLNVGQKGHGRFMTKEEIEQRFTAIPDKGLPFPGRGGTPISRYGDKLFINPTPTNNLILAITRSGKTEGLVVPSIDVYSRAEEKTSMIILDSKGNLCNTAIPRLLERDYQVYVLDFFEFLGHYYNPFQVIIDAYTKKNYDLAEELCSALAFTLIQDKDAKDLFWVEAPRSLFVACVLGIVEDCVSMGQPEKCIPYALFVFVATLGKASNERHLKSELDAYFFSRPTDNPARLAFASIEFSEGKTRSSVLSILVSKIDTFRRPSLARMTSSNSFDMTEIGFGDKPVAVFLRVPYYSSTYDTLVSLFLDQAFYVNMDRGAKTNRNKCVRPVHVIGDEIFNFPPITGLERMLAVGLGSLWGVDLYAQSFSQPEEMYGETATKVMFDNCSTTYFLSSPSEKTREMISEMCGNRTITNVSRTGARLSIEKQYTETFEEQRLIPAQELTELTEGEMIVFPTLHRRDNEGGKVIPIPLFNTDESSFLYRWQYLQEFDPDEDIPWDAIGGKGEEMKEVNLSALLFLPGADGATLPLPLTVAEQPTVADVLNTAKLQLVAGMIPSDYSMDYANITVPEFMQVVKDLASSGALEDTKFDAIMQYMKGA